MCDVVSKRNNTATIIIHNCSTSKSSAMHSFATGIIFCFRCCCCWYYCSFRRWHHLCDVWTQKPLHLYDIYFIDSRARVHTTHTHNLTTESTIFDSYYGEPPVCRSYFFFYCGVNDIAYVRALNERIDEWMNYVGPECQNVSARAKSINALRQKRWFILANQCCFVAKFRVCVCRFSSLSWAVAVLQIWSINVRHSIWISIQCLLRSVTIMVKIKHRIEKKTKNTVAHTHKILAVRQHFDSLLCCWFVICLSIFNIRLHINVFMNFLFFFEKRSL